MEIKQIYPFILTLIMMGMIIGVGLLVLGNFGNAVRDTNAVTNESTAISGFAGTPSNATFTMSNIPLKDVTRITNSANYVGVLNVDYNVSSLTAGTITLWNGTGTWGDTHANVTYRYYSDSTATDTIQNVETATGTIPATWLPLIITVMILAIILTLVIRSFGGKKR